MANAACAKLEGAGIRCWIAPRDVSGGRNWSGQLVNAIKRSKVMVLIFSANANTSEPVLGEVEHAFGFGVPIVPFRLEKVPLSDDLSFFIKKLHWLDALTDSIEQHLDDLVATVQRCLPESGLKRRPVFIPAQAPPELDSVIVIIEDDYQQSDDYIAALKKGIYGAKVRLFENAAALMEAVPELEKDVPAFIVSDLMMPWDDPNNPRSKVPKGFSFQTAGFFLVNRLQKSKALASVPVILWTAVDCRDEVAHLSNVKLLLKSQMASTDMVRHIRSVLMASGVLRPAPRPAANASQAATRPAASNPSSRKAKKSTPPQRSRGKKA